ncbi:calponin homology domain-containing protein [Chaetomium tenue]|uniref:Calponin homology domain-containing protein n=1 Tax=Chaetomium tenue TaxID=1854479 RepID=A0ACB7PAV6_9PEZI|nr:calponin homology domain-containing protein [Chaetomium globosum]
MGESRQELVQWLNSLLQLNITKVEQCGTGAALCQVYDSIFLDVPMSRVKFNVNSEYAYIQNFKVLQNTFTKHRVERSIPVESLVKCKMQDNLEFLQWTKKFWDQYYPGGDYDAVGRRKGGALPAGGGAAPRAASGAARRPGGTTPTTGPRAGGIKAGGAASAALQQENSTLKETVVGLERERDFYFSKLRDIELLVQQAVDEDPELEKPEDGLVKQIQTILYSTEEGFEIPDSAEQVVDDQETF